jgi:CheY-like chemotaxis protein
LKALDEATYIVAVTGHTRRTDRRKSNAAGIDLHLAKPADPDLIIQLIQCMSAVVGK